MRIEVAPKPARNEFVIWDGTNVDEVNTYLAEHVTPEQTALIVPAEDGSARIERSQYPQMPVPVRPNDWIRADYAMWGGPLLEVASPAEINAKYYPYPVLPPVTEPPNSDV